ncbi:MAG TPA: hypothetical protein PKA70_13945, partial [Saprospiraceae bacterium]|nr:hypothetical protein [Saprospiraceae bacterium]
MKALSIRDKRIYIAIDSREQDLVTLIRMKVGRRWHPELKQWSLPDTPEYRAWLGMDKSQIGEAELVVASPSITIASEAEVFPEMAFSIRQVEHKNAPHSEVSSDTKPTDQRYLFENQYFEQKICVCLHPNHSNVLCLYLPLHLLGYLPTVKNIHGRRWNPLLKAWELPYTKLTIRFLRKYLGEIIKWELPLSDDIPEGLPTSNHGKPLPPQNEQQTPKAKYEAAVSALEQCLLLKRYSWRTIKSY